MTNRDKFKMTYQKNLSICREKHPDVYAWSLSELETVWLKMCHAIDKGSFNKDSHAFKMTCKELRIKHTYRDIETYLGSQGAPQ